MLCSPQALLVMCFVNGDRSLSFLPARYPVRDVCVLSRDLVSPPASPLGVPCSFTPLESKQFALAHWSPRKFVPLARTPTKIMSSTNSPKAGSLDARVNAEHAALLESTVRVEATRRATLPSDGDTWQPGDGYKGKANLDAKLDAAFADESGAAKVPASCSSRHGNAPSGSRASVVAANAPPVSSYTPPALRTSLHR